MLRAQRLHLDPLDCIIVDGGPSPTIAVVICHGYGASFEDLAPLSAEWISMLGERAGEFRFVFPDAPNTLADLGMPDARAWWPINMARLAEAIQASQFAELHDQEPPGVGLARAAVCKTIEQVKQGLAGDATPLVLGGFSQGAMLAMDTALRGAGAPPDRLFLFSATLICRRQWESAMPRLKQTQVFQSHGRIDPILPFESAVALRDLIQAADVSVEFHTFMGPHTIDGESVARTAGLLAAMIDG